MDIRTKHNNLPYREEGWNLISFHKYCASTYPFAYHGTTYKNSAYQVKYLADSFYFLDLHKQKTLKEFIAAGLAETRVSHYFYLQDVSKIDLNWSLPERLNFASNIIAELNETYTSKPDWLKAYEILKVLSDTSIDITMEELSAIQHLIDSLYSEERKNYQSSSSYLQHEHIFNSVKLLDGIINRYLDY